MHKKLIAGTVAAVVGGGGLVAVTQAPSASAACADMGPHYSFSKVSTHWKRTNLRSSYIKGPGSVSLTKGRTWTVSASMTATVSAEAGIVFAKASASVGVTVGASYSGTQSFTYTLNVPKKQVRALQQYKRAKTFTVRKYYVDHSCNSKTIYTARVTAPYKSKADKNFMYALVK